MAECSELAKLISDMALNLAVDADVKNIDDIVVKINDTGFTVTRKNVVDSLVLANQGKKQELDDLTKKLNAIKNEARTDKKLTKKIDDIENHLNSGTLPVPGKKNREVTQAIEKLQQVRDELNKKLRSSVPAKRKRLQNSIQDLEKKIAAGVELPVKEPVQRVKQLEDLEYKRDLLRRQVRRQIQQLKPRTFMEKYVIEGFNVARTIITSLDLSGVFRQGGFIVFGNPYRGVKNLPDMFKAFASGKKEKQIYDSIMSRPNAPIYRLAKLYISEPDGALTKKEEEYMTTFFDKISESKVGKVVGFPFTGSGRAYTTFLNKLRVDTFDAMIGGLTKNGQDATVEEMKVIANYINVATGRGDLGKFEQSSLLLNTAFFAPKYSVSRFQYLLGQPFYYNPNGKGEARFKGTGRARAAIAKEYAKWLIAMGAVYALAEFNDDFEIEWDPRSSDFGKIRFGNTRIDVLSGISQTTVVLSRFVLGETKSSVSGKVRPLRGDKVPYGGENTFDVAARFLRTKLSPMVGSAVNAITGENVIGQEVTGKDVVTDLTVPLSFREIGEAIQEHGIPKGVALGLLSIFGMGIQTYGQKK